MLSERGKESPVSRSVFLKIEMPVTDNADAEVNEGVFMANEMEVPEEKQKRGTRSNQKLKILYLAKILLENTDANHDMTLQEIIDRLAANDVTAERKNPMNLSKRLSIWQVSRMQPCCSVRYMLPDESKQ